MKKSNKQYLMSIRDYAAAAGVSKQTIHNRIDAGEIRTESISNCLFIDAYIFPPAPAKRAGRKLASSLLPYS